MTNQPETAPCTAYIENEHTHGRQHCTRPAGHTTSHASPLIAGEGIAGQAGRIYWRDGYVGAVPHRPAAVSAAVAPPTDPTHGLSVQHADALWDAVAIPGPHTPTYPEQHERVCRAVRDILDELTPAHDEEADQTALRDRLIDALANAHHTHPCPELGDKTWSGCVHYDDAGRMLGVGVCHSERRADAVLAVLPEVADRAAVLHEVADELTRKANKLTERVHDLAYFVAKDRLREAEILDREATELRRMADETATETPEEQ